MLLYSTSHGPPAYGTFGSSSPYTNFETKLVGPHPAPSTHHLAPTTRATHRLGTTCRLAPVSQRVLALRMRRTPTRGRPPLASGYVFSI